MEWWGWLLCLSAGQMLGLAMVARRFVRSAQPASFRASNGEALARSFGVPLLWWDMPAELDLEPMARPLGPRASREDLTAA